MPKSKVNTVYDVATLIAENLIDRPDVIQPYLPVMMSYMKLRKCENPDSAFKLIYENYSKEFYLNSNEPVQIYPISSLYEMVVYIRLQHECYLNHVVGYVFINKTTDVHPNECLCDYALFPKYVGYGILRLMIPPIESICRSLGFDEIYSWTANAKVKDSLVSYGFKHETDDNEKMLCVKYLHDNGKSTLQ